MNFPGKLASVSTALMIALMALPSTGFALELGLAPSHVFGLWTNINGAVLAYAGNLSDDEAGTRHFSELEARKFSGKTPKDVLEKVNRFEARLAKLASAGPSAAKKTTFAKEITFLLRDDSSIVTPSLVFLESGRVLSKVVHAVIDGADDGQPISPFFAEHGFADKIPSDVYGLVDLALRRLDEIRIKQQAGLTVWGKVRQ